MSIEQDLRKRLTAALKAKDLRTANVIRMINTKIMERRTAKDFSGEVDDALHVEVIAAYKKSLDKARAQFEAGGDKGKEQADELAWEAEYCSQFLPRGKSPEEVRELVLAAIAEVGATDVKMVGRVVGAVMKQHKGQVEAAVVKEIATEQLSRPS